MFYENYPIEEIPNDIREIYERDVKPYIGQLVLNGHEVVRLAGMTLAGDGEWCYRYMIFPSFYYWNQNRKQEICEPSLLIMHPIPLKGVLPDETYDELERVWKMNEERCPYSKDWFKEF